MKSIFITLNLLFFAIQAQTVIGYASQRVDAFAQQGQVMTADLQEKLNHIKGVHQKVKELNSYTEYLSLESVKTLPVSVSKNLGGQRYDILIDKAIFTPYGAEISASFMFVIPKTDDTIFFTAEGIPLHSGGLTSEIKLNLLYAPPIRLSDKMSLQFLPANSGTFVSFNCDGYKGMGISARVNFSEDMIVQDRGDGTQGSGPVYATFSSAFEEWNEFTAELSFSSPFQVSSIKGFGFTVYNAVIDLSDLNTPGSVTFPSNYYVTDRALWQGVYIKEFDVRLPKQFKRRSDGTLLMLSGQNILIDALGLTGQFSAIGGVLPLNEGDMNGWDFSVDSVGVNIVASRIGGAGIRGELIIPVKKNDGSQNLRYVANIFSGDEYLFGVGLGNNLDVDLWKAKLELVQGSHIEVAVDGDVFKPKAILTGSLTVDAPKLSMNQIIFEGLVIQTEAPYFSASVFGLAGEGSTADNQKMSDFPVTLNELSLIEQGNLYGIHVDATINLCGEGRNAFGGQADFTVFGEITKDPRFKYDYKKIEIGAINVNIESGGFTLNGTIVSYNDNPIYGQGFKGMVRASMVEAFSADVTVQFGKVRDFRYWYFDGAFTQPVGTPVFTGICIYGFGGGAYNRMRREIIGSEKKLDNPDKNEKKEDRSLEPGITLSGVRYIPDENSGLGLRASVIFGAEVAKTYNGELALEVAFTSDGGLGSVGIDGRLLFANPIEERFSDNAPILATVNITYYVPQKILSAGASVAINLPSGITGGGDLALYISPSTWYYYVGHPNNRMHLSLAGVAEVNSYLMIGNQIPPMPLLPAIIRQKLSITDQRNESELASGRGFCFGVGLDFNSGDKTFLCFFAKFQVLAGMDVMIRYYEQDQICSNTGNRPGFGGFYSSGQLYAYLQGDVGIKATVFGEEQKLKILSIGAGLALQAKAPKPTWLKGVVAGEYSILDGLIKGSCRFELEIGERCEMSSGNLLANVKIISSVTPSDKEHVDVFSAPRAGLNIAESKTYNVTDENGRTRYFSVRVAYTKVMDGATELRGVQQWNAKRDIVSFIPHEILPPNKSLTFKVKAYFVELVNGAYTPYKVNGRNIEEESIVSFTTGDAPNYVPSSNITYSYPMEGQYNVYKNEFGQGYVQLLMGQNYLFGSQVDQTKWTQVGRLTAGKSSAESLSFTYNAEQKRIEFPIPTSMQNASVYSFTIVNISKATASGQESGRDTSSSSYNNGQVSIKQNSLLGNQTREGEIEVFGLNFRTSKYNTFTAKMQSIQLNNPTNWSHTPGVSQISMNMVGSEYLDAFELNANNNQNIKPMVQLQSEQTQPWFTQHLRPLMYNSYPIDGVLSIQHRDTSSLGLVPAKAVFIAQTISNKILSSEEAQSGSAGPIGGIASLIYDVSWYASADYGDLRQQGAARLTYTSNPSQQLLNLINTNYPNVKSGSYTVRAFYVLPGTNQITSSYPMILVNP